MNDNAPLFQRRDYAVTVPEDVAVGTEVLRVLATSVDIGLNAEITYRIRSGNELGKFTMDRTSGEPEFFVIKWGRWSGRRRVSGSDTWQKASVCREPPRCTGGDRGHYLKDRKAELEVAELIIPAAIWKGPG